MSTLNRVALLGVAAITATVARCVPAAGAEPAVTFSKDMITDRMWSFCQISKETFPTTSGQIHYESDKRTCVLPVKLEPGKTYVIWCNRGQFNSFRDTQNTPAVPYLLVFETSK